MVDSPLIAWLAGFISGAVEGMMTSPQERQQRRLAEWRDRWLARFARPDDADESASLLELRQALVGRSRGYVVQALGPPSATAASPNPKAPATPLHYWHAPVWYYPLDLRRKHAIAFEFDHDRVTSVQGFEGPA